MKATIITDSGKFNKLLDSIKSAGAKLEVDVHTAGVSALYHAGEHGDIGFMVRLIDVLPGFARRNALIAWAIAFGKFQPSEDGKSVAFNKHGTTDLDKAEKQPFWEFKPEPAFQPFDLQAELAKLLKRAEKSLKDERNSIDSDDLIAVRELAAKAKPVVVKEQAAEGKAANDVAPEQSDDALAGVA